MIGTKISFSVLVAVWCVASFFSPARASTAESLAWLIGFDGFDPNQCYAFPVDSTGDPKRALFVCADEDDPSVEASLHLALREAGRSVRFELDAPVVSGDFDLREGPTYEWAPGWYYQLRPGQPSLPRLGDALRRAARTAPANVSRLYIEPGLAMSLATDDAGECAALVLDEGAKSARVDCVDPAVPASHAVDGLRRLATKLGASDLRLEAWAVDDRHLREDRFFASLDDAGRRVVSVDAFEKRLEAARDVVDLESLGSGIPGAEPIDAIYRRLRLALVHAPNVGVDEPITPGFVQSPEIYLLEFSPTVEPGESS